MEKLTIKLDASACKKSACDRLLYFNIIEGISQPHGVDASMTYGTATHKYSEVYVQTKDMVSSIAAAHKAFREKGPAADDKKEWLNINHLTQTCAKVTEWIDQDNVEYYINPVDNKPMCEVRFAIPFKAYPHVDIILCGTIDKIVKFKRGATAIGDYKTTATYKVDTYFEQYKLDPQMMMYRYVLEWFAKHSTGILAEIGSKRIGTFIDGIFLSKTKDTEIRRSPVMFYSDEDMQQFASMLDETCLKIAAWTFPDNKNKWPLKQGMFNGACTHLYGQCKYFGICSAPDSEAAQAVIKNHYIVKPYDPLTFF